MIFKGFFGGARQGGGGRTDDSAALRAGSAALLPVSLFLFAQGRDDVGSSQTRPCGEAKVSSGLSNGRTVSSIRPGRKGAHSKHRGAPCIRT